MKQPGKPKLLRRSRHQCPHEAHHGPRDQGLSSILSMQSAKDAGLNMPLFSCSDTPPGAGHQFQGFFQGNPAVP
eukprot:16093263-Heterocapsa_arctica.AAC.1